MSSSSDPPMTVLAMGSFEDDAGDRDEELRDYIDQLEHALGLVAAYARYEPELTLWCCRRVGELALRCIHISFGAKPTKKNATFRELKSHKIPGHTLREILDEDGFGVLDVLQNLGNLGVHARKGAREKSSKSVKTAIGAVHQVVEALFSESALTDSLASPTIRQHLAAIHEGGLNVRLDRQYIESLKGQIADTQQESRHWKAKAAELVAHIEHMNAGAPPPPNPDQDRLITQLRVALSSTEEQAQKARRELLEARATVAHRDHKLAELQAHHAHELSELQALVQEKESVFSDPAAVARLKRKARRRLFFGLASAAALILVLSNPGLVPRDGLSFASMTGLFPSDSEVQLQQAQLAVASLSNRNPTPRTVSPETDAPLERQTAPAEDAARDARAALASVSRCPSGTVHVKASEISIAPPQNRPSWPAPRSRWSRMVDVESFCVDESQAESDHRLRPVDCNPDRTIDAASCVNWRQAKDRCVARGGGLPTIVQWEAAVRQHPGLISEHGLVWEWADDSYPPTVFGMVGSGATRYDAMFRASTLDEGESPDLRLSWNRQDGSKAFSKMGYRCAFPISDVHPQGR